MDTRELLEQLKGAETRADFAARLGLNPSTVSKLLLGKRVGGRAVLAGLVAAYPERQAEIVAVFCGAKKAARPYSVTTGNPEGGR